MSGLPKGLISYLRAPFVMIVWVMETYTNNRERLKAFMAQPRTAKTFKVAITLTGLIWVAIAVMANEQQGERLTDAMQNFWTETQTLSDDRKTFQDNKESAR